MEEPAAPVRPVPPRIAVVGERVASPTHRDAAWAVGREIALRGGVLICGGMGGVMEAASEGCASAGGLVVGILPGEHAAEANPCVAIPVATGMGEARNAIIARTGEAMIAIGGSYGTLSEIAFALHFGVPVIGIDTWQLEAPGVKVDPVLRVSSAAEAVEKALGLVRSRRST